MDRILSRAFTSAALLALASGAPAQGRAEAGGRIEFVDDPLNQEEFQFNDARVFRAWTAGGAIHFEVEMAEPLAAGMFTCVRLYLDTDGNENTGLDGAELWVRASVGSRFHPNSFRGQVPAALEIRRTTWSDVMELRRPGGGTERRWRHQHDPLPPPVVEGQTIAFSFPIDRVRAEGSRYGSVVGIRPVVETSCSEQPLMMGAICTDEGIDIDVDGNDDEWSTARVVRDGVDLHAAARFLDLLSLRVEHDGDKLFACVGLAASGFADDSAQDPGMDRQDAVHLFVQPMFPRYQSPCQATLEWGERWHGGRAADEQLQWSAAVGEDTIEFEIERRVGQTLFRVFAWSDLRRFDTIGLGEFHLLDWAKTP